MTSIPYSSTMVLGSHYWFYLNPMDAPAQDKRSDANDNFAITAGAPYPQLNFGLVGIEGANWEGQDISNLPIQGAPISVQPHKSFFSFLFPPMKAGFGSKAAPTIIFLNPLRGIPTQTDANGKGSALFTLTNAGYANVDLVVGGSRMLIPCQVWPATKAQPVGAVPTKPVTEPVTGVEPTLPGH